MGSSLSVAVRQGLLKAVLTGSGCAATVTPCPGKVEEHLSPRSGRPLKAAFVALLLAAAAARAEGPGPGAPAPVTAVPTASGVSVAPQESKADAPRAGEK